ncbi:hypothetical protein NOF04DRAFT_1341781 [Fusarium oxysporum II5]|nr:hypothetical protein NOF04DRAFT_1341781 [Fusarium oxysporum II5]
MRLTETLTASKRNVTLLANGGSKLIWKAYAIALLAHMTTQDDLDNSIKAIFVASAGLFDIPAGEFAPQEITNNHNFRRTDALQNTRSPFYTSDGESYFDSRRKYLQAIHDDSMTSSDVTGSISKLRSEVEQAQDRSAQAYLRDLDLYNKSAIVAGSELANFAAWGEKFGIYYVWAKREQKRLESDYTLAATKTSSSVGLVLAAFDLARDTSTLRLGPLYSTNGIDRRVDSWVGAQDGGLEEVELDLDLSNAKTASWASLGFPNLDQDPLYDTKLIDATSPKTTLSLQAGGMQAFDVDRGFCQLSDALAGSGEEKILGMKTDRCTIHNDDGQVVVASAPSGFPTVLAVLGREI